MDNERIFTVILGRARSRKLCSMSMLQTMSFAIAEGKVSMNAISTHIGISTAAITGVCDKLIALGMIKRTGGICDRRISWIEPTQLARDTMTYILNGKDAAPTAEAEYNERRSEHNIEES